jgi:hypothetical protein
MESQSLSLDTLAFARDLTRITLGLDRLYRQDLPPAQGTDSLVRREGLVAINLSKLAPEPFSSWNEGETALRELAGRVHTLPEPDRRVYYGEFVDSLAALAQWHRRGASFTEQIARFIRVPAQPIGAERLDGYRQALTGWLAAEGYKGDLSSMVQAWEEVHRIPEEKLEEVFMDLQAEGRRRSLTLFDLPDDPGMALVGKHGVSYNAYCDYVNRKMYLNLDSSYTTVGMKHLVCHEIYPGHYVHMILRESLAAQGRAAEDVNLVVTDTASSATFEGIAEQGIHFLNWMTDVNDAIGMTLTRLRAALACSASWRLHVVGELAEQVAAFLRVEAIANEGWVGARMRFLTYPLRAPFIFAYWYGDQAVEQVWRRVPADRRPGFFPFLYTRLHSPRSLELFF